MARKKTKKKTRLATTSAYRPKAGIAKPNKKRRAIRGVADVSSDQKVDIGPPNSRETW